MEDKEILLKQYLNEIDPYNMIQFGDPNIYLKEVKLILREEFITSTKIENIFKLGYRDKLNTEISTNIFYFIIQNVK